MRDYNGLSKWARSNKGLGYNIQHGWGTIMAYQSELVQIEEQVVMSSVAVI